MPAKKKIVEEPVSAPLEAVAETAQEPTVEAAAVVVEETEVFSSEGRPAAAPIDAERDLAEFYDEDDGQETRERRFNDFTGSRLPWLVDDFTGVTSSVYEAVMVAAHRARQVGRRQKREIDAYNTSQPLTSESIEQEEFTEKGVDHFRHIKPTVKALDELRRGDFEFYYPETTKEKK